MLNSKCDSPLNMLKVALIQRGKCVSKKVPYELEKVQDQRLNKEVKPNSLDEIIDKEQGILTLEWDKGFKKRRNCANS